MRIVRVLKEAVKTRENLKRNDFSDKECVIADCIRNKNNYSYLKASTGFLREAFQVCTETVSRAMVKAITPARVNSHQLRSVL